MAFEHFTRTGGRIDTPKASIWSKGQIGFNQAAVEKYRLDNYGYVLLFYDRDTKRIGLRFTNDNDSAGATKLIIRKGAGASMSARAFLKHYNIYAEKTQKYDFKYDKETEFYIMELEDKNKLEV